MSRYAIPLSAGLLLAAANAASALVADDGGTVTFASSIDHDTVEAFIASVGQQRVGRIVVTSDGGEITAGIRLGNWIVDRGLDVEVHGLCASSCANYVFTAGRHKLIDDGALIVWHGSASQANFRALLADCPRRIQELEHEGGDLVDHHQTALAEARQTCAYFFEATAQQAAFFARVGIDERITRIGQEPHDFRAAWTVSVATMARFGITQVEAPAGYASHGYLQRFNAADDPDPILALGFHADGAIVEEAVTRRKGGAYEAHRAEREPDRDVVRSEMAFGHRHLDMQRSTDLPSRNGRSPGETPMMTGAQWPSSFRCAPRPRRGPIHATYRF